jgi:hypothetical protein
MPISIRLPAVKMFADTAGAFMTPGCGSAGRGRLAWALNLGGGLAMVDKPTATAERALGERGDVPAASRGLYR